MKLYCMRHGLAENVENDAKRNLTDKGRRDVEKIARHLFRCHHAIQKIIHSDILRATQTADIVAKNLPVQEQMSAPELLGEAGTVEAILESLLTWKQNTLLIGHLPLLFQLVNALVIGNSHHEPIVDFAPGSVVCLDALSPQRWMIEWMISPEIIA